MAPMAVTDLSQHALPTPQLASHPEKPLTTESSSKQEVDSSPFALLTRNGHDLNKRDNVIYENLSQILLFSSDDRKFWWKSTASILGKLMERAHYNVHEQYFYLLLYHAFCIPALGPQPRPNHSPQWRSFMTDDFSPIELSWNFTAAKNMVRFAIEPIGIYAGGAGDPFNQMETIEFMNRISAISSDVDLRLFNHFVNEFFVSGKTASTARQRLPTDEHASQAFVGFDLDRGRVSAKAYLFPLAKAAELGISPLELVSQTLGKLNASGFSISPAWALVEDYIRSQNTESQIRVEIISFDCIDPRASRIKIYVRSPSMSLATAKDMFTLGGRLRDDNTIRALGFLEDLWKLVLSIPPETPDDAELSLKSPGHRTGGLIFNFELKPGNPFPEPKLYIPVRHYGRSDIDIANGLATFFRRQAWSQYADSYVKNLQDIFPTHSLEATTGAQTYISFSYKKVGGVYLSTYFNPRIYSSHAVV